MQKNNKKILCHKCNEAVTSRNDLITAMYVFTLKPYHAACYSKRLTTLRTFLLNNYPMNSFSGTLAAYLIPIAGILWIFALTRIMEGFIFIPFVFLNFFIPFLLFGIIASLLPSFIRLYSYYVYEKPLAGVGEKIPRTLQLLFVIPFLTLVIIGGMLLFLFSREKNSGVLEGNYMECQFQDTEDMRLEGGALLVPTKKQIIDNIQIVPSSRDITIISAMGYKEFGGRATIKRWRSIAGSQYTVNGIINTSVNRKMTNDGIIEIEYEKVMEKKRAVIICNTNLTPGLWE